jgi:serine/threonine protein kinase
VNIHTWRCNGCSLACYCDPDNRLPLDDAVRIIKSCAVGVHFAHSRGLIHRDVKPRNILLGVGFEPKLSDFGLSVLLPEGELVSPRYRSPEQINQRPLGVQTDIFNLGVVLYQLIVGRHPFSGTNEDELSHNVCRSRHVRVRTVRSDVPKELQTITNRCLAKSPANRYETAMHLAADLDVVLDIMAASTSSISRRKLLDKVKALPYFKAFSERELDETLHHCAVHNFRPGDEVISVGDEADCFYIVVEGEVGLRREEAFEISHLGPGECVGEVGALTGLPRSTTVIALDRCTLLSVPMSFFDEGPMACQLRIKDALLRGLARRMAEQLESVC